MPIDEIKTVCYVGAGTMGCYNAIAAAISGYSVVLYDVDDTMLEQVPQKHREMAAFLVGGGYCSQEEIPAALERVKVTPDLVEATRDADLVSESVFERLDVKRDIHRRLDEVCPAKTILTTNASILQVSDIEDVVARGDRFAALHSHLGSPLVDIVAGPRTDPAVIEILERYVESISGVPLVLKKEHPGYVLNAMLGSLLRAALALVVTGAASREDVDRAWMQERGAPMGPFGMMDLFGLDLILDTWLHRAGDTVQRAFKPAVLKLLQPMVDSGETGMKAGKGFYDYPEPRYQQTGFIDPDSRYPDVYRPLATALVTSALALAAQSVAEPEDVDRAWMVGTFLDTGPFTMLEQTGRESFLVALAGEVAAGRISPEQARVAETHLREVRAGH
jgi:3-hydroxybutyryl-CoA dehydrogenase